jgi:hypothetical protein
MIDRRDNKTTKEGNTHRILQEMLDKLCEDSLGDFRDITRDSRKDHKSILQ